MATVSNAAIAAALTKRFHDRLANQIQRSVVLAQLLPVAAQKGPNIQWVARTGSALGSTIADGADVATFNNDDKRPAVLQYGIYNDAFAITGLAMAAARAAGEPAELSDLFMDEMGDCAERLAKKIGIDMYTGAGGANEIHGLTAAAGPLLDSGVYAGIDRAGVAQWQSNVVDAAAAPLSLALMRQTRRAIYEASGEKPDLIICSPAVHDAYGALMDNNRRYVDEVRLRGEKIRLDGGYQVLEFEGTPVVEDVDCPANTMLFLNTRHCSITQLADSVNAVNRSMGMVGLAGTDEHRFGPSSIPVSARVNVLARTGDAYKFQLISYLQLCVKRPNAMGQLINLA